ncbi:MAG: Sir2 family NAD-dependent protein deacetylase [Myxococcota bacterium]|nr:Sir2 family NAD-dependent protein deacetylase [Myxococcota bacterium]
MHTLSELASDLTESKNILFLTGAGISVASGISPFRGSDPDAVWNKDIMEKGTFAYFREDTLNSWIWYLDRFDGFTEKKPNSGHISLQGIEQWSRSWGKRFTLITQNIDTLHRKAGSKSLIEIHGRSDRVRCARTGCDFGEPGGSIPVSSVDFASFKKDPCWQNIPRCSLCRDYLRPHVLWFDEYYNAHEDYGYEAALGSMYDAQSIVFVGTSFAVGVTEFAMQIAARTRATMWAIDPVDPKDHRLRWINGRSEEILPTLLAKLEA